VLVIDLLRFAYGKIWLHTDLCVDRGKWGMWFVVGVESEIIEVREEMVVGF
jgi:hypothetical protein